MTQVGHVHADLVGPPCLESHIQELCRGPILADPSTRDRSAPSLHHGHSLPVRRVPGHGRIHGHRALIQVAPHGGTVQSLDPAPPERVGETHVRAIRLGDHQEPRRIPVQSMHDSRPQPPSHAGQVPEVEQKGIHQRSRGVPRRGMDHHTRRLVHHRQLAVLVDDIQWEVLRHDAGLLRRRDVDLERPPRFHRFGLARGSGLPARDRQHHLPLLEEALDPGAGKPQSLRQEGVGPGPRRAVGDHHLAHGSPGGGAHGLRGWCRGRLSPRADPRAPLNPRTAAAPRRPGRRPGRPPETLPTPRHSRRPPPRLPPPASRPR